MKNASALSKGRTQPLFPLYNPPPQLNLIGLRVDSWVNKGYSIINLDLDYLAMTLASFLFFSFFPVLFFPVPPPLFFLIKPLLTDNPNG